MLQNCQKYSRRVAGQAGVEDDGEGQRARAGRSRMTSSTGACALIGGDARASHSFRQIRQLGLAGARRPSNRVARFGSRAPADVTTRDCAIDYVTDASNRHCDYNTSCVALQCVPRDILTSRLRGNVSTVNRSAGLR